ncbi:hypothetical protein BDY19DRAFT_994753 [Irpex rosettiformis]|uniref:Uncharacterized protein n=1 Tax=Irpex rosettiformis TaxID=378272 RepID=A0ACB8U0J2_9APHY|nr:hypothetical protein BDY19DRAFT_994753 [Irpex rosettiformis]
MSQSSSPLSYVTLPDSKPESPARLSQLSPESQSGLVHSTDSAEPEPEPEPEPVESRIGENHRTFTQTLTDGLEPLTDLILSNRTDLEEVKELIYERYAKEDKCRGRVGCGEVRDMVAGLSERMRADEARDRVRTPRTGEDGDQMDRLMQELDALREEREQIIKRYMQGIREMQDHQTREIIRAIQEQRRRPPPQGTRPRGLRR